MGEAEMKMQWGKKKRKKMQWGEAKKKKGETVEIGFWETKRQNIFF